MGDDINLFKDYTIYLNDEPVNTPIKHIDYQNIVSESQTNDIQSMELFNTFMSIKLTYNNIKKLINIYSKTKKLINIYSKTKKFRTKKKLAKRIDTL